MLAGACSKSTSKPSVSIAHYGQQTFQINEAIKKLMEEPDVKTMKIMAEGLEATRAIGCDAVGEECNLYYGLLNKMVDLTKDGELNQEERTVLLKIKKELDLELKRSEIKNQNDWKNYINAEKRD